VPWFRARSLASPTSRVLIERQVNYGNTGPGRDASLPTDDPYLYAPEVTRRLYDRIRQLTDQYGYDFRTTATGQLVLRGTNTPTHWQSMVAVGPFGDLSTPTTSAQHKIQVAAIGGTVFEAQEGNTFTKTIEGYCSKVSLVVGVGQRGTSNGGRLTAVVQRWNGTVWAPVSTTIVSTYADVAEAHYYDEVVNPDGTPVTVVPIFEGAFGRYRVTFTPAGRDTRDTGSGPCLYRLNGC